MELKDFVAATLENILAGIKQAQASEHGDAINPQLRNAENIKWSGGLAAAGTGDVASVVSFDVAVTATEGAGAGAKIGVMGIGLGGDLTKSTVAQNRIQFSVPLILPKASRGK